MKPKRIWPSVLMLLVSSLQYGCASQRSMYVLPENVAVAQVNSAIRGAFKGSEQITVSILKEKRGCSLLDWRPLEGQRTLFIIDQGQSYPEGAVSIEANKPLRLRYSQDGGSYGCEVLVEVTFDPGKEYTFFGGNLVPENPNTAWRCMFGIKDQSSGQLVKVEKLSREALCSQSK